MMILAIETATRQLGVAVTDGKQACASYELLGEYPHAVELPEAVNRVLKEACTTLQRCEAIVVDIGPGSFTGLRIGLAFAKALAYPNKKPLVGVSSLDVLAAQLPFVPQVVCPMLDAKQKNVYAALYRLHGSIQRIRDESQLLPSLLHRKAVEPLDSAWSVRSTNRSPSDLPCNSAGRMWSVPAPEIQQACTRRRPPPAKGPRAV